MATTYDYNTITSEMLNGTPKMTVPDAKPDTTNFQSIIDGALTSLPDLNKIVDTNQQNSAKLLSTFVENNKALSGKEAYSQAQQDLQGVNTAYGDLERYNADFNDIASQLKGLSRASQAVPLQIQEQFKGTGATDAGVAPHETSMLRNNAIKALTLATSADILGSRITNTENRIQLAKDRAQLAVDLKYKPLEQQNQQIKDFLDLNEKYLLGPADKKRTEALNIALNERTRKLEEDKANEKTYNDLLINAQTQLAPPDVIARARSVWEKTKNVSDVIKSLGVYAGAYQQALLLKEQITEKKQANSSVGGVGGTVTENAKNWLSQYNSGEMSLQDIYTKIGSSKEADKVKNEFARLVAEQGGKRKYGADDASVQAINAQIKNINDLLEGDKYTSITGIIQGGAGIFPDSLNTGKQDILSIAKNLVQNQTLQALADAKSKGVTFGALSEKELTLVSDSASRIASKIKMGKDDVGNDIIVGFSGSEKQFREDLETIRNGLMDSLQKKVQVPDNPFKSALGNGASTPIQGTAIVKSVADDGTINFDIPKK